MATEKRLGADADGSTCSTLPLETPPNQPRHIQHIPTQWPSEPRSLDEEPLSKWINFAIDFALCLAPLLLLAKAVLVIYAFRIDEYRTGEGADLPSRLTYYLTRFNSQLVTLFTIIFGTIVATLVKRYALWKAQRGATVAELEQFQSSVSLPSTLKMVLALRAWTWKSAALVVLWAWYYLGSQAVSREYVFQESGKAANTNLTYRSDNVTSAFQNISGLTNTKRIAINGDFNSAYNIYQDHLKGIDVYGAALLPLNHQVFAVHPDDYSRDGWFEISKVSPEDGCVEYTSRTGIKTWTSNRYGFLTDEWMGHYTIPVSYIYAYCSEPMFGNASDFPAEVSPTFSTSFNISNITDTGATVFTLWQRSPDSSMNSTCKLMQQNLSAYFSCTAKGCVVLKTKASATETPSPVFTDMNFARTFFNELLLSGGTPDAFDQLTTVELNTGIHYWVPQLVPGIDSYMTSYLVPGGGAWVSYGCNEAPPFSHSISAAMTIMVNTYMAASQRDEDVYTNVFSRGLKEFLEGSISDPAWPLVSGSGARYEPGYKLSIAWLAVDITTCVILLICAIVSFWLRLHTTAPDIFGYVSSMTRDNPHIPLPEGGSTLSGVERARALKGVKVTIADLHEGQGVGHIGLAALHSDVQKRHLSRSKQYI